MKVIQNDMIVHKNINYLILHQCIEKDDDDELKFKHNNVCLCVCMASRLKSPKVLHFYHKIQIQ